MRVGHFDVDVVWCTRVAVEGVECAGAYSSADRRIYVDMTADEPMETFLHEYVHAEISESGLRQHPHWDSGLEEIVAERLAFGLLANFRLYKKRV